MASKDLIECPMCKYRFNVKDKHINIWKEAQKELAVKIEDKLDKYNGENGNKNCLCKFCHATEYKGLGGIVHENDCIISELRDIIKK